MANEFDFWALAAGIALFLFAMAQLEAGLKALGGRPLAIYLRQRAGTPANAVLGGIVGTALLQSSSVLGLIVLAFSGAGLLNLTSALGIVFGSNLGTTLTGWIVATLGFKFEIFELALPIISIGGAAYLFGRGKVVEYGRTIIGLGLLLLGLQLMKNSVMSVEQIIDIDDLEGLAAWQYLLFGTIVAAIIQSSSATMIITLAALNAGIINLPNAAAIAIGADLGTTTTIMLGAVRGSRTKQQVAAGQVLFNVVTDVIAFLLRTPLLSLIALVGITDPLYALVAFHSLFNIVGLLIFIPLIGRFARLLERILPKREAHEALYLREVSQGVSEAAVDAAERETSLLIARALRLTMVAFEPRLQPPPGKPPMPYRDNIERQLDQPFEELYRAAKQLEGELVEFVIQLQAGALAPTESTRLSQLLTAARETMHSAKAIKDIRHNLIELAAPANSIPDDCAKEIRATMQGFLIDLYQLRGMDDAAVSLDNLAVALQNARTRHNKLHDSIYTGVRDGVIDEAQVSTLLNMTRELLTCSKSLVHALGNYYLSTAQVQDLERLPA